MSDRWTESISEYLDGGLEAAERRLFEAHVAECAECAATVEDLRLITSRARTLPTEPPKTDLWPGIEARIRGLGRAARPVPAARGGGFTAIRFSFSLPQLAAASLALVILSGGAVWYALRQGPPRAPGIFADRSGSRSLPASQNVPDHVAIQDVQELGRVLAAGREKLDPATVRSLEESLLIIDVAIRQAKRALDADPNNPYVRAHLDDTMRRKVEFLRRATMLASAPQ
ncbi:MAG TPA: zf-HC2 domain-containing protein [Candidatus Eisenbacteria bacterium]|nr:zf-HC2 domain-containing protein [Candidatus Eisenbacteria bacterium]